eukprot:6595237-Karenia_brevis.AAC.1
MFSAMPPLEAYRLLISLHRTMPRHSSVHRVLAFYDIPRAHPHSEVSRDVFVRLPSEAALPEGMCARLLRCIYGLRDANQTFELKVGEVISAGGLVQR